MRFCSTVGKLLWFPLLALSAFFLLHLEGFLYSFVHILYLLFKDCVLQEDVPDILPLTQNVIFVFFEPQNIYILIYVNSYLF